MLGELCSDYSSLAGHERILPFDMVFKGRFKGTLQYQEVPFVETLPLPVSLDHALALGSPPVVSPSGFDSPAS